MTIRSRTAALDGVSGDLARSLAKLDLEAARGAVNADEEIDFVRDLSRAALLKEVGPWRTRALKAGLLGLAALAAAVALRETGAAMPEWTAPALLVLAALALVSAGALYGIYLRHRSRERHWLLEKEVAIAAGRPILDER
ncbi:MAG: hypothetical protein H6P99_1664 [Holophagaceae bacterium]|nr:hypothetical protein [Holophagaceae bacterium]